MRCLQCAMNWQLLRGNRHKWGMVINELYSYAEIYYLFYRVGVSFGVIRIRQVQVITLSLQSYSLAEMSFHLHEILLQWAGMQGYAFGQTLNLQFCGCLEVTESYNLQISLFLFSLQEMAGNLVNLDGQIFFLIRRTLMVRLLLVSRYFMLRSGLCRKINIQIVAACGTTNIQRTQEMRNQM